MGNHRRKQNGTARRVTDARIEPMEIWDCDTGDGILWDHMYTDDFPEMLVRVLAQVRSGTATSPSHGPVDSGRNFDAVYIGGGGSQTDGLLAALEALPGPSFSSPDGRFSGEVGGQALAATYNGDAAVVDVGQSSIKISWRGRRSTFARDFIRLPIRSDCPTIDADQQVAAFCDFAATSVRSVYDAEDPPPCVVLALPCWIGPDCQLGGSSYTGMKDHPTLLHDLVQCLHADVLLVNDAELTAHGAALDPRLDRFKHILVLTLGFGVGAAMLHQAQG